MIVRAEGATIKVNPLKAATNDRVETITYTVTDENGATDTATLTVNVGNGAPPAPNPAPAPTPPATDDLGLMLSVIDADTDAALSFIKDGDIITLDDMSMALNFAATTELDGIGSMKISLNGGPAIIENVAPYAAFGNVGADFNGQQLPAGNHSLTFEVYDGPSGNGALLGAETINFEIVEKPSLLDFYIADASSDVTLADLDDGDTFTLLQIGDNATFYAMTESELVETVRLTFEGQSTTERVEPYALFGDVNGDFKKGLDLDPGAYALEAEAFDTSGMLVDTIELQFDVI